LSTPHVVEARHSTVALMPANPAPEARRQPLNANEAGLRGAFEISRRPSSLPLLRPIAAIAGSMSTIVGVEEEFVDGVFPASAPLTKRKEEKRRETKELMPMRSTSTDPVSWVDMCPLFSFGIGEKGNDGERQLAVDVAG